MIRVLFLFLGLAISAAAAEPSPLRRAHAHNDYEHTRPLLDALEQGFCGVEADIWLVDGKLLVAHDRKSVRPERTLTALYLDPLRERVRLNRGRVYRSGPTIMLLVDIKSEAGSTYRVLHDVLRNYRDILTTFRGDVTETKAITVVISGNRPREEMAAQTERFAAFDGRAADLDVPTKLIPLISDNVEKILGHKWQGALPAADHATLQEFVARAHAGGRQVRFWNTPDRIEAWTILAELGVDWINTDNLAGLARFLRDRP